MAHSRAVDEDIAGILRQVWGDAWGSINVQTVRGPGAGLINRTYALENPDGERWYLRISPSPERLVGAPGWLTPFGLRRETEAVQVLSANSRLTPLLPRTVATGEVDGADWVIQQAMPGFQASTLPREVRPEVSDPVWRACGDLVGMIHAVQGNWFGPVSDGLQCESWLELMRADADGLISDADRLGLDTAVFERLCGVIEERAGLLSAVTRPTLIHSDLSLDHVFLEETGNGEFRVSGVIDLEFARYVDADCEKLFSAMLWRGAYEPLTVDVVRWCIGLYGNEDERNRVTVYAAIALGWNATLAAWLGDDNEARRLVGVIDELIWPTDREHEITR